jgi:hypothetical protein
MYGDHLACPLVVVDLLVIAKNIMGFVAAAKGVEAAVPP